MLRILGYLSRETDILALWNISELEEWKSEECWHVTDAAN